MSVQSPLLKGFMRFQPSHPFRQPATPNDRFCQKSESIFESTVQTLQLNSCTPAMAVKWYPDKPDRLAYDHYVSLTPSRSKNLPPSSITSWVFLRGTTNQIFNSLNGGKSSRGNILLPIACNNYATSENNYIIHTLM